MPIDKKEGEESFFKKYEFVLSLAAFIILIFLLVFFFGGRIVLSKTCGDGSSYGSCANIKPYYCEDGFLIEKASVCGCGELSERRGDLCFSQYQAESKEVDLNYLINGEERTIDFTVYKNLTEYLSHQSRAISYQNGIKPVRADFKFKVLDEEQQRELLLPLVVAIQNLASNKEDQVRIAISLVQNIEYGFSNKTETFFGQTINYSRYPYEVLYDSQGICGEKSELLAFLLRELGYGVAIFYNQPENHEAVGIKCPLKESYRGTGYCFVETTAPAIISDDEIIYVGDIRLNSKPEVIIISDGESLPHRLPEYRDAEIMKAIRKGELILLGNFELGRLEKKYGLAEEYNPA